MECRVTPIPGTIENVSGINDISVCCLSVSFSLSSAGEQPGHAAHIQFRALLLHSLDV